MLKWIKDTARKSRAAVTVQNLFATLPVPFIIPGGPAKFANSLVEAAWSQDTRLFEGRSGPAPHQMSIAAISLAIGMEAYQGSVIAHTTCKGALSILIAEMSTNRFKYALNGTDLAFLEIAQEKYESNDWMPVSQD